MLVFLVCVPFEIYAEELIPDSTPLKMPRIEYTQDKIDEYNEKSNEQRIPALTYDRISSEFGVRKHPIQKKIKKHNGIDLPFPKGTAILAPAVGVVSYAGWMSGFGNVIKIDHGNGYETLIAHNAVNLVHTGQSVTISTTIAKVGATGSATGPHIHFEIRFEGALVNPLKFLRKQ